MLTINDFSDLTQLPAQTLRYYHAEGLLVPADVDDRTGYRSYTFDQVRTAMLVTVLRAGSAVTPALIMALDGVGATSAGGSATSAGWQRLRLEAVRDGDVVQVWRDLGRLWRSAAFEEVAAAWQLSARHGCPLADAMEGAARSVRARRSHRACVDGATAGAKASTSVLLGLPVLGVGLGMLLGVDMLGCYSGFSGLVTLWPGIALMFVGARWSRRMTASALKAPTEAATS